LRPSTEMTTVRPARGVAARAVATTAETCAGSACTGSGASAEGATGGRGMGATRVLARLSVMPVAVRVIPCLDVDAGRVVEGVHFETLRDAGEPVALARRDGEKGADELTSLDVPASSGDRATTYDVVARTAEQVFIPLTVGGGVRTVGDVDRLLRAGADKVGMN